MRISDWSSDVCSSVLLRRWDHHRRRILLSEALLPSARAFHLAVQIALLGHRERLDRIVERVELPGDEARGLFRMTLANYFAGAVMKIGRASCRERVCP